MRNLRLIRTLLVAFVMLAACSAVSGQVLVPVNFGPPALPVYAQPPCPAPGYMWTPGYWAWGPDGYYWVPGTWVLAPQPGLLWTPGYWAWDGGPYYWHPGYWGPVVGFYGGIPYGYGYPGAGYYGGEWRDRQFYYNQTVNNVNVTNIRNVYNTTVINNNTTTVNRVSYNGGPGGITARPTPEQETIAREKHVPPTSAQLEHENTAKSNRQLLASVNRGRPPIAATVKPAQFTGRGVVAARHAGAPYKAPSPAESRANSTVPRPGNNIPRSEAEQNNIAPRANVPRPPSASEPGMAPRPQSEPRMQNAPRPDGGSQYERAPRPETAPRPQAQPGEPNVPRPENAPRPEPTPQRERAPYPENPPRPQAEPRPQYEPRPEAMPQREAPPRPENAPRPENEERREPPR